MANVAGDIAAGGLKGLMPKKFLDGNQIGVFRSPQASSQRVAKSVGGQLDPGFLGELTERIRNVPSDQLFVLTSTTEKGKAKNLVIALNVAIDLLGSLVE